MPHFVFVLLLYTQPMVALPIFPDDKSCAAAMKSAIVGSKTPPEMSCIQIDTSDDPAADKMPDAPDDKGTN